MLDSNDETKDIPGAILLEGEYLRMTAAFVDAGLEAVSSSAQDQWVGTPIERRDHYEALFRLADGII